MEEDIKKCLPIVKGGGIILYPSDTMWGIGCDATDYDAVSRILEIKKQHNDKRMIMLVNSIEMVYDYVNKVPEIAASVAIESDKPLTIIYPDAFGVSNNLIYKDKSLGIRIVKDDFCQKLISQLRCPLVLTSANISGKKNLQFFSEINDELKKSVDYVVKWRQNEKIKATPASIIQFFDTSGRFKIIRK